MHGEVRYSYADQKLIKTLGSFFKICHKWPTHTQQKLRRGATVGVQASNETIQVDSTALHSVRPVHGTG